MKQVKNEFPDNEKNENQWKSIYTLGGITTIIVLIGIVLDIIIGNITGGNLSALPQTAVERFAQFKQNPFAGLYNLDLLNMINQIMLIPVYVALYAAHRHIYKPYSLLALIFFLVGTTIFVVQNTALPMLELSNKYFASNSDTQKNLYAAAGEALLAKGSHGSSGVFVGFLIPNIAGLLMSLVMLRGKIFSKTNSLLGMIGSGLILVYIILVTFAPNVKEMATAFAMPGGLMLLAWMIMFMIRLFKLGK